MSDIIQSPEFYNGFGTSTVQEIQNLRKALSSGYETDVTQFQGGQALSIQSLEDTLVKLTFTEKQIKFFTQLKKSAAKATNFVEEYRINDGYGSAGGWVSDAENAEADDPALRSEIAKIKFLRNMWRVNETLNYTNTITPAMALAQQAAMMRGMRTMERSLFFGDDTINPYEINGLKYHIENNGSTDHVFDLRGTAVTESIFKQGMELIYDNYGTGSILYNSPAVQTTIDSIFGGSAAKPQFIAQQGQLNGISAGYSIKNFVTSFGTFDFEPNLFIAKETWTVAKKKNPSNPAQLIEGATSVKAPAMPVIAAATDAPTVTGSKWASTGYSPAGTYGYRVGAINQYGESMASVAATAAVAANGAITLTITETASAYATLGYRIYREAVAGSGVYKYVKTIKYTSAVQTWQDLNEDLPGTGVAFLLDMTGAGAERVMKLGELAPIHSQEYARIAPQRWGSVNYYPNFKVYSPLKLIMIKNILVGDYTGANPLIDL